MRSQPRLRRVLLTAAIVCAGLVPAAQAAIRSQRPDGIRFEPPHDLPFLVGFDKQMTDPPAADVDAGTVHLGGFGLGPTRATTGPLVDVHGQTTHIYARAVAISNRRSDGTRGDTMLFADLENQGTFAAYKQGPYGITDVRNEVSAATGVPVENIVVNSDHSHAGIDLIGLWGGVPTSYLKLWHDQTVKALETAYANAVPAQVLVGSNTPVMPPENSGMYKGGAQPGEALVHSQFSKDDKTGYDDSHVDTELRVLQAIDKNGRPLGTLINYAAHATVMGSSNLGYSGDWPAAVATATEQALGEPVAVTMVADVGRSQPPRPCKLYCGNADPTKAEPDKLETYSSILQTFVTDAVVHATPVNGTTIANREIFTREAATNAALLGVSYSGEAPLQGFGAYRAVTPPWVAGDMIGTFVSAHRLGDILFTAAPGEAYPDIRDGVQASTSGFSRVFTFGLANDQLGYLVAPTSEYPWITTSNPGNDNSFFNVSAQYGDHVMCSQSAAAVALGFAATGTMQPYGPNAVAPPCPVLTASDPAPMGPAPQQPWPVEGISPQPPSGP